MGGYHDLPRAMRYFTTDWYEHVGGWHCLQPDDTGPMVLACASLDCLPAAREAVP